MTPDELDTALNPKTIGDYDEVPVSSAGKRLGVQWAPWMSDFFTSWSPRNNNNMGEGPWAQWVDLALRILQDPMTKIVRPEARAAVAGLELRDFYAEADVYLTEEQLRERFGSR